MGDDCGDLLASIDAIDEMMAEPVAPAPSLTPSEPVPAEQTVSAAVRKTKFVKDCPEGGDVEAHSGIALRSRTEEGNRQAVDSLVFEHPMTRLERLADSVQALRSNQRSWSTAGIVVSKSTVERSSTGKPFIKLRVACSRIDTHVMLMCFDAALDSTYTCNVGTVLLLLRPSVLPPKKGMGPALSVSQKEQLRKIGAASDLAECRGKKNGSGQQCGQLCHRTHRGGYCSFHIAQAAKEATADLRAMTQRPLSRRPEKRAVRAAMANLRGDGLPAPTTVPAVPSVRGMPTNALTGGFTQTQTSSIGSQRSAAPSQRPVKPVMPRVPVGAPTAPSSQPTRRPAASSGAAMALRPTAPNVPQRPGIAVPPKFPGSGACRLDLEIFEREYALFVQRLMGMKRRKEDLGATAVEIARRELNPPTDKPPSRFLAERRQSMASGSMSQKRGPDTAGRAEPPKRARVEAVNGTPTPGTAAAPAPGAPPAASRPAAAATADGPAAVAPAAPPAAGNPATGAPQATGRPSARVTQQCARAEAAKRKRAEADSDSSSSDSSDSSDCSDSSDSESAAPGTIRLIGRAPDAAAAPPAPIPQPALANQKPANSADAFVAAFGGGKTADAIQAENRSRDPHRQAVLQEEHQTILRQLEKLEERGKLLDELEATMETEVVAWKCDVCKLILPKADMCRQQGHSVTRLEKVKKRFWQCRNCKARQEVLGDLPRPPPVSCVCGESSWARTGIISRSETPMRPPMLVTGEDMDSYVWKY
eukprot:TRINITY_DN39557_c0_g1_i1.p1 TRINITY_DN39557_c0_g1~~TRINITY_DN39557_c0_g1_i1.p1  ORF type:complete len:777 (+),score=192.67 TRINITY_DN39557_c0_g1_i1:54-2333(+)